MVWGGAGARLEDDAVMEEWQMGCCRDWLCFYAL